MAYKFKDPKLARLAAHHKRKATKRKEPSKPKHAKKRATKKRVMVFHPRTSPLTIPEWAKPYMTGHEKPKATRKKAHKKATKRRTTQREVDERIEHEHSMKAPRHHKKATHKKATHKKATHKKATHKKATHKKATHKTAGGMAHATQMIPTKRLPNLGFAKNYIKRADLTAAEKTKLLKLAHHTYK
jgi:hypothetical protein